MVPYDPNISQLMRNISPWLYHGYTMVAVSNPPLRSGSSASRSWRPRLEGGTRGHKARARVS